MDFELRSYGRALQAVDLLRGAGYADASIVDRRPEGADHIVRVSITEDLDERHVHQLVHAIDPGASPRA
jgi:hypothetical protein